MKRADQSSARSPASRRQLPTTRHAVADGEVAVAAGYPSSYPENPPFHPPERYPELRDETPLDSTNHVYAAVRQSFRLLGLDASNFGSAKWNPLGELIRPGDFVVLKPNFLQPQHLYNDEWIQVVTHGAIVRAVTDYVQIALQGTGQIAVADAPATEASFRGVCEVTGTDVIAAHFRRNGPIPLELVDIRQEEWVREDFTLMEKRKLDGDPRGYRAVRLNQNSEFMGHEKRGLYGGPGYDEDVLQRHHSGSTHEYLISGTVMDADVVINLPKLKTHKLAGVTCCLKNLVGINGDKTWLPHHTCGFPESGGDQFASPTNKSRLESVAVRWMEYLTNRFPRILPPVAKWTKNVTRPYFGDTRETVRNGSWYGNQTLWRMALDLNKALVYADSNGELHATPQRRVFQLVDAIIGGEGDGPMAPTARPVGVLIAGANPVAVDAVCATIMGFDYRKIPSIERGFETRGFAMAEFSPNGVSVASNDTVIAGGLEEFPPRHFGLFEPHFGWKGHIEASEEQEPPR